MPNKQLDKKENVTKLNSRFTGDLDRMETFRIPEQDLYSVHSLLLVK